MAAIPQPGDSTQSSNVVDFKQREPSSSEIAAALRSGSRTAATHEAAVRRARSAYANAGWRTIPIEPGAKMPRGRAWQSADTHYSADQFREFNNIGVALGEQSGYLTDVDIDDRALVDIAKIFLPATGAKFGRYYGQDSQQLAHYLYRCPEDDGASYQLKRPGKGMAIEIRGNGKQTIFPPSYIYDKTRNLDLICWDGGARADPPTPDAVTVLPFAQLKARVNLMCATFYSLDQFLRGDYHLVALAWIGALAKCGYTKDEAWMSMQWVIDNTPQTGTLDRERCLEDTYRNWEKGADVTGVYGLQIQGWDEDHMKWLKALLRIKGEIEADGRPQVRVVASKETQLYDDTLAGMVATRNFYNMSGAVVVINKEVGADNAPTARMTPLVDGTAMGAWLTREIQFIRSTVNKETGQIIDELIKAPSSVAVELANPATYRGDLPHIVGTSNVPTITRDGRIVDTPWGYDPELKVFFACRTGVRRMYPDEALSLLREPFVDFPFALERRGEPEEPSRYAARVEPLSRYRAAAVGALLSAVVRPAMDICPAFVITSSQWGDGKSVMSNAIAAAVGMEGGSPNSPLTRGGSDEEQEKQVSSTLARGKRVVVYDNHDGEFRSATLTETLTSANPEFRVLGKNEIRCVPNRSLFVLNGVNMVLAGDLQTRSINVRLARLDPHARRVFRHADVVAWAARNSGELISAAVSLVEWALRQDDGDWRAEHRFKIWDAMVRRTILLACGVDIAPPIGEDDDREIDPIEETKRHFIEWVVGLWGTGMRDPKSKSGFRAATLAEQVAVGSAQEGWIDSIARTRHEALDRKVGRCLSAVQGVPISLANGVWCVERRTLKGSTLYSVREI